MASMLIFYLLVGIVLINCTYYLVFSRFSFAKGTDSASTTSFPVSVLVCARNESENLKSHIPFWLDQNYPEFELILINDASIDDTLEIMNEFATRDPRIKVVDVARNETFWGSKKYALTLGIKRASHKRLLFTDADCRPDSKDWIAQMTQQLDQERQLVIGYGGYMKQRGLLNTVIRYETILTATQYFSYAMAGFPYMGVGRNLAYTSNLFFDNSGFTSHMDIRSGDDDLFVNKVANSSNTICRFSSESFTYSVPKSSWRDWFLQKKRHISTAKYYKPKHKTLLGLFYISNLAFWITAIAAMFTSYWKYAVVVIGFRFLLQLIVIGVASARLKERSLIFYIPVLELFLILSQLLIFSSRRTSTSASWK